MYFAILGRHPQLSLVELQLVKPLQLKRQGLIVFFFSELEESAVWYTLERLGGIVKRGSVVEDGDKTEEIGIFLQGIELVGVSDTTVGMSLKKEFGVKRFKLVDQQSSDLEIKQHGKEIMQLGNHFGLVHGRQNIHRLEVIDIEKPVRGMQVGMMPAKLTQIMINIGIGVLAKHEGLPMSDKRSEENQKRSEEEKTRKYNDKTSIIIGCAIDIHKKFHDTITESQFKKILADKLREKGSTIVAEKSISIMDGEKKYGNRFIDLEIDGEILIECKKTTYKPDIQKGFRQVRNYMELGGYPVGLFLNTGFSKLQINRFNGVGLEVQSETLQPSSEFSSAITIYDPFCGFGTTGFVANSLGYHFLGSDINITSAKQNQKRWFDQGTGKVGELQKQNTQTSYADETKHFTLFKHDVTKSFVHPLLKQVDLIITEGRLGPIVKKSTRLPELDNHAEKIISVYEQFLTNIKQVCPGVPIVITVPNYPRLQERIPAHIQKIAEHVGFAVNHIDTYTRKGQEVIREVYLMQ